MCNAFAQNSCDVTLFAYIDPDFVIDDVLKYYDVNNRFKIIPLKKSRLPFAGIRNGLFMAYKAGRIKADIVLGRDLKACFFGAMFRQKVYFEIHAPIIESGKVDHILFRWMMKLKGFQKLVLITQALDRYYKKNYPTINGKTLVLPDGADKVDHQSIRDIVIKKQDKINIGYTGHLYAGKGMEIIAELLKRCPFAHFHIVGGREEDIAKWNYLTEYKNVTFYGYVNPSEVKHYIAEFDIVLLPNQRKVSSNAGRDIGSWTSPLKLFEYMAMGKPIICSDLEVLKEIARHGENAYLCDPDKIETWVEGINILTNDPKFAQRIAHKAQSEFENNYTWGSRANHVVQDFLR